MFSLPLLAPLVVLLVSEGTEIKVPKCEYKEREFCKHMEDVYRSNVEAEFHLKGGYFPDVLERLVRTNEAVRVVLRTKEKEELLTPLLTALHLESGTLFQMKIRCTGTEKEQRRCTLVLRALYGAVVDLIAAIMNVAETSLKQKISKAYEDFKSGPQNRTDRMPALVTEILKLGGRE